MSKVIVEKNKDKVDAPKMKVIKRIGDELFGIVYYTLTGSFIQRRLAFRLYPAQIEFELIRMRLFGGKIGCYASLFTAKIELGIEI